jgi:hypothetical protein
MSQNDWSVSALSFAPGMRLDPATTLISLFQARSNSLALGWRHYKLSLSPISSVNSCHQDACLLGAHSTIARYAHWPHSAGIHIAVVGIEPRIFSVPRRNANLRYRRLEVGEAVT